MVVDVRQELARVQVAAQAAGGSHDRYAALLELFAHEVDEDGALADDVLVHGLLQAHGDGLHLTDAHAAVGEEALKHGHQLAHLLAELAVAHGDATAAGKAELARGEVHDVELVGHRAGDLADGHVLAGRLARLYEVEVILQQAGVQHGHDAVLPADPAGLAHVLQAQGLAAD